MKRVTVRETRQNSSTSTRTVPEVTGDNITEICQKLGFERHVNINRVRRVDEISIRALYSVGVLIH